MQGIGVSRRLKTTQTGYSSSKVTRSAEAHTHIHVPWTKYRKYIKWYFLDINHLYVALRSFKYNIASIYTFRVLPWQHHIRAGHFILIVPVFDFNICIIHEAVMRYANYSAWPNIAYHNIMLQSRVCTGLFDQSFYINREGLELNIATI